MASQGSAYARSRRALDTGNATVALATAIEFDFVSLSDALELVPFWSTILDLCRGVPRTR